MFCSSECVLHYNHPPLYNDSDNISFAIGCFLTTVPGPSGQMSSWWGSVMTTVPGQLECGASVCSTTAPSSEWSSSADEVCENNSQDDWYVRTSTDKFHSCPHRIRVPFCMCPQWEAFWILITAPRLYHWLCSADKMHMFDHQYYYPLLIYDDPLAPRAVQFTGWPGTPYLLCTVLLIVVLCLIRCG